MSFPVRLLQWFRKNARVMPWRDLKRKPDPYRVWVSEMMLQQTTVATVGPYFRRWIAKFPSIRSLALSDESTVLKQWQGLGYYTRARNMLKSARLIVEQHNGQLPGSYAEWLNLPGVGPYTAAAVASIAFNEPVALVDANVRRVMMRILAIKGAISPKNDPIILTKLKKYIPVKNPGHFNQAMMELGALVCRAREPICNQCPVSSFCEAYQAGIQETIPEPAVKVIREIDAVIALIEHKGLVLIQQRPSKGLLAGLWEFPGGKIEPTDLTPVDALLREVKEETGLQITVGPFLTKVTHSYTRFRVKLSAYICHLAKQVPLPVSSTRWVKKARLNDYPMPSGSAKVLKRYLEH